MCVFLSGGVDSAIVAGIAAQSGSKIEGITIGFDEFSGRYQDEVPSASSIAEHYGMQHFVRRISRSEFESDIPRIFAAMDQPSIDGVNSWFASKAAAERGYKVALSGVGGDELFCGYSNIQRIPRDVIWGNRIAAIPGLRSMLRLPFAFWAKNGGNPKFAALLNLIGTFEGAYFLRRGLFLPEELPSLMGVEMAREGLARLGGVPLGMTQAFARDGISAVGLLESTNYLRNQLLRDGDWASMAHSLELRTPLVDVRLLEALGPSVTDFKGGAGKAFLANSPTRPLPESIINRPKTGFGLPMAQWLSESTTCALRNNQSSMFATDKHWSRKWAVIVADQFMP
jgi:asparagine synthase (glutamine-hydrolysing)